MLAKSSSIWGGTLERVSEMHLLKYVSVIKKHSLENKLTVWRVIYMLKQRKGGAKEEGTIHLLKECLVYKRWSLIKKKGKNVSSASPFSFGGFVFC